MSKAVSRAGWEAAVALAKTHLGLPNSPWLASYAKDVCIDTRQMVTVVLDD